LITIFELHIFFWYSFNLYKTGPTLRLKSSLFKSAYRILHIQKSLTHNESKFVFDRVHHFFSNSFIELGILVLGVFW